MRTMMIRKKYYKNFPYSHNWFYGMLCLCLPIAVNGQAGSGVAGGHGSGENLKISYSVGQVFNEAIGSDSYYISQGMQHPMIQVSVEDTKTEFMDFVDVMVFPNPSSHSVNVRVPDAGNDACRIQLISLQGQILEEKEPLSDRTELSLRDYASGTYFIKVIRNEKNFKLFKIIKTHE